MIGKTCFKQEKRDLIPEGSVVEKNNQRRRPLKSERSNKL
jgi:hypothetical protein